MLSLQRAARRPGPERLLFLRGLPRPGGARGPPRRPALCGLARRCRYPRRRPGSDALPIGVSGGKRLLGAQERPAPLSGASGVAVAPGGAALALQIEFENRGLRPRTADQHIAPAIGVGQDLVAMVGLARAIGGQTGPAIAEFARRLYRDLVAAQHIEDRFAGRNVVFPAALGETNPKRPFFAHRFGRTSGRAGEIFAMDATRRPIRRG